MTVITRDAWRAQVREQPIEPDLPIIDAHHHIWPQPPIAALEAYTIDDLLADKMDCGHNIVATVFMEAHAGYRSDGPDALRPVGETELAAAAGVAADRRGGRAAGLCAGIVAHADMLLGDAVGAVLDAHQAAAPDRFRGIRQMTARDPAFPADPKIFDAMLGDARFRAGIAQLHARGLSFDAWVFHPQLHEVADLAAAFPDLPIVLDHVGTPIALGSHANAGEAGFGLWRDGLAAVAERPNTVVKLGGLSMPMGPACPPADGATPWGSARIAELQRRYLLTAIELFGPDRCMMESNFPVDRMALGANVLWNMLKRVVADFSRAERETMFAGTAARVYRLDLPLTCEK